MTNSLSIFSSETLDSIAMAEVIGGDGANNCHGGNCASGCACSNTGACDVKIDTNVSIACIKRKGQADLGLEP